MNQNTDTPLTEIIENGKKFAKDYSDGKAILRSTNGKKNYEQIAQELEVSKYHVSTVLNIAKKYHLAKKLKPGVFKKERGVMSHIPETKIKKNPVQSVSQLIKKAKKKPKLKTVESPFSNIPVKNLNKMVSGYQHLYVTENTLRALIRKAFGSDVPKWWEHKVNKGIKNDVKIAIEKYPYYGYDRRDGLEYTHLGQLKEIITSKNNWKDFSIYLHEKDKTSFSVTIDKAIPSRNSIGHCIPLKSDDLKYVEMRFQDILNMIK